MNFSKVLVLFSYNKIKLNRYIFAKFLKINYSDNLTKKKNIFASSRIIIDLHLNKLYEY